MTDKSHLLRFGYAPGRYWFVCSDCEQKFYGDKFARRCETCAGILYSQVSSVEAVADKHRTAPMTIPEQAVLAATAIIRAHDTEQWGEDGGDEIYEDLVTRMLTAAAPHLAAVRVNGDRIEAARKAVEELAHVQMNLPLEDWSRISSAILSALEPSAGRAAVSSGDIVDALFKDLRGRRFLKWLFSDRGDDCLIDVFRGGDELRGLDLEVQQEIRNTWEAIIERALASHPVADKPDEAGAQGEGVLAQFWRPISEADKSITFEQTYDIGDGKKMTIRNSDHYWVRDADGRVYEATWSDHKGGYWWDLEGESPVDPIEYMPHPLSLPTPPVGEVA